VGLRLWQHRTDRRQHNLVERCKLLNYFITSYGSAFKLRYKPGWNLISLRASDWRAGRGSPSWANIVSIRIRLDSRAVNTYSFDGLTSGVVAQPAVIFTFDKV